MIEDELELLDTFGPAHLARSARRRPARPHPHRTSRERRRLRVVVLAGGLSHERDVSLRSGRRVADALRGVGRRGASSATSTPGSSAALAATRPDAVFPVLHGAAGEDGALRDVLDLLGVPYVGADAAACRGAFDKPIGERLVARRRHRHPGLGRAAALTFRELGAAAVLAALVARLGLPLVVKPARGGSALGVRTVARRRGAAAADGRLLRVRRHRAGRAACPGTEVAVSVVDTGDGPRALPAVEIVPRRASTTTTPATPPAPPSSSRRRGCPTPARPRVAEVAAAAHTALGLRDLSRTDLIVRRRRTAGRGSSRSTSRPA